jgi:hypothetical protein
MLAERRMARVIGRIMFLTLSIRTMKGIRAPGVLCGTRWANISLLNFIQPNIIIPSHRGMAIVSEMAICLVEVKIYGKSPRKLLVTININRPIRMNLKYLFSNTIILNSLYRPFIIILTICLGDLFFSQNELISNNKIILDIQFNESHLLVDGSNAEKRLAIMIRIVFLV